MHDQCSICKSILEDDEVSGYDDEGFYHYECFNVLYNKGLACAYCNSGCSDTDVIIINVPDHGIVKLHVDCYTCANCASFDDLTLHLVNDLKSQRDMYVPICEGCRKCYNCKSDDYEAGRYFEDPTSVRKIFVMCSKCMVGNQNESS